jgi:hypothetical protein
VPPWAIPTHCQCRQRIAIDGDGMHVARHPQVSHGPQRSLASDRSWPGLGRTRPDMLRRLRPEQRPTGAGLCASGQPEAVLSIEVRGAKQGGQRLSSGVQGGGDAFEVRRRSRHTGPGAAVPGEPWQKPQN